MRVRLKHQRLRRALLRRNVSQNRWAQIIGISPGYLSMLANGQRSTPSAPTRRKLLRATGLEFDELFEITV